MREPIGRYELKHHINKGDIYELHTRLPCIMKPDENSVDGKGYRVRSLYFDNYSDKALREKVDGLDRREKFRIRLYNGDVSFIRLEKKCKKGGMCFKENAVITTEECKQLLLGNRSVLRENGDPLCLELYTKMHTQLLRPKNIVDYMREAFVFSTGNVRITLDYDICGSSSVTAFLNPEIITIPIPLSNTAILEVKYDNFLPEIIRSIVSLRCRQSTAFSKYAATRI